MKKIVNNINRMKKKGLKNIKFLILSVVILAFANNSAYSTCGTMFMKEKSDTLDTEDTADTTIIRLGKKEFTIVEKDDEVTIDRYNTETGETKRILESEDNSPKKNKKSFKGHWSGLEFGVSDLLNSDFALQRPEGYEYLEFNTSRSWNFNINFAQSTTPIIKDHLALVSGFGLEMNYYRFQGDNSIQINDSTGIIEERILVNNYDVKKSKMNTTYLTVPLILEAQFGKGKSKDKFYVSGGLIGGFKITSAIKVKHDVDGKTQKFKERGGDLNLNPFRVALTARMGYKDYFNFYANYYITPLFQNNMGPELHPFALGIRLDF